MFIKKLVVFCVYLTPYLFNLILNVEIVTAIGDSKKNNLLNLS